MIVALCAAALAAAAPSDGGADAGTAEQALLARAEAALGRGEAGLEEAAQAFESAAGLSLDPGGSWLRAARARASLAEALALRGSAQRGPAAAPMMETSARHAQACADDARRAWRLAAPEAAQAALQSKPPAEVAALVPAAGAWAIHLDATCAGIWARAQGITPLLERHSELRAFFSRAATLDPALDDAGPDRESGRLLAALPAYAGGDLDAAKAHFDKALKLADSPRTRVVYAESLAVKLQDRALFESLLEPLVKGDDKSAAADKARALLQRADELFGRAH